MTAYFTAVFKVDDEAAFRASPEYNRLYELMKIEGPAPFTVSAMSHDHEMRRVDLIQQSFDRYKRNDERVEAIEALLECPDLTKWDWEKFDQYEDVE
jgi:hypothetical protein